MSVHLLKPSEIKSLLALVGKMKYTFKTFIGDGDFSKTLLLEDSDNQHQVVGKMVERYNLGEFQIWPRLQHENLNPLLDMMANDDGTTLFVCPFVGKSLRDVIEDSGFGQHPKCFGRKKKYARDILSGLEYLHKNSICSMNLTENIVLINSSTDKAVISDFSRAVNVSSSDEFVSFEFDGITLPPEATENDTVHPIPFDIWTCGFMFLQMFTKHVLPWCSLGHDLLDGLDIELLRRTNKSSCLKDDAAMDLKGFLKSFLCSDPNLRVTASEALSSWYLEDSNDRLDEPAREFWKAASMIMPFNKPNGQALGEGDMKSTSSDRELPQNLKLLNPLLDWKSKGETPSLKSSTSVVKSSEHGRMASQNFGLRKIGKDSSTDTSGMPAPSIDLSHSLWNNEVPSEVREKMKENLIKIKEKFKQMKFPSNRSSLTSIDNELTFVPRENFEMLKTPPSRSSNSSFGLEKLFIHNETPLRCQINSISTTEQFSLPKNNIFADHLHQRSPNSPSPSILPRPRPDANLAEDQLHQVPLESPFQPAELLNVKIPEAEKFSCQEKDFRDSQSSKGSHKSVNTRFKTGEFPKIKIQGNFLQNKSEKGNASKVQVNPTFDDFRITCRLTTGVNENQQLHNRRVNSPFPTVSMCNPPSQSRWPTTAEMKHKHPQRKKQSSSRSKDRSKSREKKPAVNPIGTNQIVKPPTGAKTAVKTVKPKAAVATEQAVKPETMAGRHTKHGRSKTKEGFDVNTMQNNAIEVSLDTPLFTYGLPKILTEDSSKKKKKGFFHLPCRKSKSGKKSTKDKSSFGWF